MNRWGHAVIGAATLTESPVHQVDMRSVLLPASEHPEGSRVSPTVTLREAVAQTLPGTVEPSGIVVMPRCIHYFDAIGGLGSLQGWHQFGFRSNGAVFIHLVAKAPRNATDLIRMRVAACGEGFQTFQGWPPSATGGGEIVSSTLSFTERPVPVLPNATSYGVTESTTFHQPDHPLARTIRQAWQCTDGPCTAYDAFVTKDDLFIWIHEGGNEALADQMARTLYNRASG